MLNKSCTCPSCSIPWHMFKGLNPSYSTDICSAMFIATLFTTATKEKQPKCPSAAEWIVKMWYIYNMKHNSPVKIEILSFEVEWLDLT